MAKKVTLKTKVTATPPRVEVKKDWSAPGDLEVRGKDPRFIYHWVGPRTMARRLDEGWVMATGSEKTMALRQLEGGQKKFREMVLMKMPKEMVEQRKKFYREQRLKRLKATKRTTLKRDEEIGKVNISRGRFPKAPIDQVVD